MDIQASAATNSCFLVTLTEIFKISNVFQIAVLLSFVLFTNKPSFALDCHLLSMIDLVVVVFQNQKNQ